MATPTGELVGVLPNHFKSKYGGDTPTAQKKRTARSARTAEIYNAPIRTGEPNVVVLGDLNDTPDSPSLKPLLDTPLKDVSEHALFDPGGTVALTGRVPEASVFW